MATKIFSLLSFPTVYLLVILLKWNYNKSFGETVGNGSSSSNCRVVNAEIGNRVDLNCMNHSSLQSQWLFNGNQLYAGTIPLTYKRNVLVESNPYILILDPIELSDEGTYSCKKSKHLICTYDVNVFALPEISIFVNGSNILSEFHGLIGTYYNVTCSAISGRPPAVLVLKLNNVMVDARLHFVEHAEDRQTFNSYSTFLYKGEGTKENLTCLYKDDNISGFRSSVMIFMETFAFPQLSISCNGTKTGDILTVSKGMLLQLQCMVNNVFTSLKLKWSVKTINRSNSDTDIVMIEDNETEQFDNQIIKLSMWLIAEKMVMVTCQSWGKEKFQNQSQSLRITVDDVLNLTLSVNGQKYFDGGSLFSSKSYNLTCLSSLEHHQLEFAIKVTNEIDNGTNNSFNKSSLSIEEKNMKVIYPRNVVTSKVTCLAKSKGFMQQKTFFFEISAIPVLRIQLEHLNISQVVHSSHGEILTFKCVAFSARMETQMYFQKDNLTIGRQIKGTVKPNKYHPGTFDTEAGIEYHVHINETVTCCLKCNERRLCTYVDVGVLVKDQLIPTNSGLRITVTAVGVSLTIFLLAIAVAILRQTGPKNYCFKRSLRFEKVHSTSKRSTSTGDLHYDKEIASYNADAAQLATLPPRIELPTIPLKEVDPTTEGIYSKMTKEIGLTRIIDRKKICLLTKLPSSRVWEKWIGTTVTVSGTKKCVSFSKAKAAIGQKTTAWELRVQKILEMPRCPSIAACEGFCVDNDNILLVQEYTPTEELGSRIAGLDFPDADSSAVGLLLNFASQVILGMEFLVSHGLSHPGLSTKQVFVTEANVCQLFDFCLREEASMVMAEMRQGSTFKHRLHPPEATMRDEYNHGTDMWYTGKTVIEIFSQGTNFHIQEEDLVFKCGEKNEYILSKPTFCPTFLFDVLVNCWRHDPSLRPTFAHLRSAMEENCALFLPGCKVNLREQMWHETSEEDLYIPMEEKRII